MLSGLQLHHTKLLEEYTNLLGRIEALTARHHKLMYAYKSDRDNSNNKELLAQIDALSDKLAAATTELCDFHRMHGDPRIAPELEEGDHRERIYIDEDTYIET